MFPGIQIVDNGIKYGSFGFFGILHLFVLKVNWSEIKEVVYLQRGVVALGVSRPGWSLFNGLFYNRLYGYLFGIKTPIILLSPGMEKKDEVVAYIIHRSHPEIIRKIPT
jgi:hypothetical protein